MLPVSIKLFDEKAIEIEKAAKNTRNGDKVEFFVHGALYPDVIESPSFKGPSATIEGKDTRLHNQLEMCSGRPICGI